PVHNVLRRSRPTHPTPCCRSPSRSADYTLSLHDALPIYLNHLVHVPLAGVMIRRFHHHTHHRLRAGLAQQDPAVISQGGCHLGQDRKSTRLNSSHVSISYAVFCLKKKTNE